MNTQIPSPICAGCKLHPHEIKRYRRCAEHNGYTPDEFAKLDPTYNPKSNTFRCDSCFLQGVVGGTIKADGSWVAP